MKRKAAAAHRTSKAAPNRSESRTPPDEHVAAAEFKARCLELLDLVRQSRRPLVVTKRGKPVARVVPYDEETPSIVGFLRDTVAYYGDILSPIDEPWDADAS